MLDLVPLIFAVPRPFIADQPFLFAIVKNLNTILFAGQFAK
ncbi:unnamed protein product [Brugia pahangi]|nr:unnamed protein product [Brugia pahangi]